MINKSKLKLKLQHVQNKHFIQTSITEITKGCVLLCGITMHCHKKSMHIVMWHHHALLQQKYPYCLQQKYAYYMLSLCNVTTQIIVY
jgi:hypothetical protein